MTTTAIAPQPLKGVRIVDLTWMLASAGTTVLLSSLGAEVIRIEWPGHLDFTRRQLVAKPKPPPLGPLKKLSDLPRSVRDMPEANTSGLFSDRNAGKLGITLNMRHHDGVALFKKLVAVSDIVIEGFRPNAMPSWGLDYETIKAVKPDIIYLQMAGFGRTGPYGSFASYGPTAQVMSGIGALTGLPHPHPPTMWNHSYMDVTPPFYGATALMAALYYRNRTGQGQYIDQAQYEPGLFLSGAAVLDYSAHGRRTARAGNRSPYIAAAPHAIYRCAGDDCWIAIAVFDEEQWRALCREMGDPAWSGEPRFATMPDRLENLDELDSNIEQWTREQDRYALMYRLQETGVPAGAVQSPGDKFELDPQLKARDFFVDLPQSRIGTWPHTRHFTPKLTKTPAHPGGITQRGAPCVGEDNRYVYEKLLGLSAAEIAHFEEKGVI
ncbi:MAG TPA: CoA transferase [Candidatus Binataceae bacterium]|nr:CoA transferase [Candidatus Binataceae bacterium]